MSLPHTSTLPSGVSCILRLADENDLQQICDVFEAHTATPAQKECYREHLRTNHLDGFQYVVCESEGRVIAWGSRCKDTIKVLVRRPALIYKGSGAAVLAALEGLIRDDHLNSVELRADLICGVGNVDGLIQFYLDQRYSCAGGYTMKKNLGALT